MARKLADESKVPASVRARFDTVAITKTIPTAENKKAAEEWNRTHGGKATKKPTTTAKKKK